MRAVGKVGRVQFGLLFAVISKRIVSKRIVILSVAVFQA
jgi:hypothetical protein